MAEEEDKTEEPTDKKVEDARKEGNVGKSAEVVGALTLTLGSVYLLFFSSATTNSIKHLMYFSFDLIGSEMNGNAYYTLFDTTLTTMLVALSPLFVLIVVLVLIGNWAQFGFLINPLKLDVGKINPLKGIKTLFALKKVIEAAKLAAKLFVIIVVMCLLFLLTGDAFLAMMDKEFYASLESMIILISYFLAAILLIIIIFAIMDFFFTKHYYVKSLKMSKQEIKDEYKNMEGDPLIKGRIRKLQMKMAQQRMMQNVPDADVIITNPTHYAVALKYDKTVNVSPLIIAKGIDFLAIKIKDIANENNIPIIENPALARALYDQLEVDQSIPEEFFKAIAEIFTYIYELKK